MGFPSTAGKRERAEWAYHGDKVFHARDPQLYISCCNDYAETILLASYRSANLGQTVYREYPLNYRYALIDLIAPRRSLRATCD